MLLQSGSHQCAMVMRSLKFEAAVGLVEQHRNGMRSWHLEWTTTTGHVGARQLASVLKECINWGLGHSLAVMLAKM